MSGRIHLPLFLLAFAIALVVKFALHDDEQLRERRFVVDVQYLPPEGVTILEQVDSVEVRLRGRSSEMAVLSPFAVEVSMPLAVGDLGTITVPLEAANVSAPVDFEVVSIRPNQLTLTVEREVTARLAVEVRLSGEPAAGSTVERTRSEPGTAVIRGPESRVERIQSLQTTPISLDGHAISFQEEATVVSPDPLVQVQAPNRVQVEITMREPELSTLPGLADNDAALDEESGDNPGEGEGEGEGEPATVPSGDDAQP